jgi:hypothetical protein
VLRSLISALLAVSVLGAGCGGGASSDPKDVGTTDVIHIPGKPAQTVSMEISNQVAPSAVGLKRCQHADAVDTWGRNVTCAYVRRALPLLIGRTSYKDRSPHVVTRGDGWACWYRLVAGGDRNICFRGDQIIFFSVY